ncbi:sulfatase-like hydrolase/transferase [Spirosoma flavus]
MRQAYPLCLVFWLVFAGNVLAQTKPNLPATRPNIVLIVADDLGYTDLSYYGHKRHRTPYLDSLARRGIRFTQAYTASPVCSSSNPSDYALAKAFSSKQNLQQVTHQYRLYPYPSRCAGPSS